MILGHRTAGYCATLDGRVVGETRQCIHCQYVWVYKPGSGTRRGFCLKCYGLLCARPGCVERECTGPFEARLDK